VRYCGPGYGCDTYLVKPLEWDPLVRLEIDDILRSLVRILVTEYVLLWVWEINQEGISDRPRFRFHGALFAHWLIILVPFNE
jgi:hypothetical protein